MAWYGHTVDPSDIETRFSIEDGMGYLDSIFTEPTEEAKEKIKEVQKLLDYLPAREADFIDLYFFKKLRQTEIAELFDVSQPTVCYRLQRATARIQFMLQLPQVNEDKLRADLILFLHDPLDVKIMMGMWRTTCQSEVAKSLGLSQGLVRHRFLRTVKKLKQHGFLDYVDLFEFIGANLNILREVSREPMVPDPIHILD